MATIEAIIPLEDKYSATWKNITLFFSDGSQVTTRDHPEDPLFAETLAAKRKVVNTEFSVASISGSYMDCHKQL